MAAKRERDVWEVINRDRRRRKLVKEIIEEGE